MFIFQTTKRKHVNTFTHSGKANIYQYVDDILDNNVDGQRKTNKMKRSTEKFFYFQYIAKSGQQFCNTKVTEE